MTLRQLKRMKRHPQERMNPQKLHIQDVHNFRLLSVIKYLMSFRNCDWQNEMWRKLFVSDQNRSILRNIT